MGEIRKDKEDNQHERDKTNSSINGHQVEITMTYQHLKSVLRMNNIVLKSLIQGPKAMIVTREMDKYGICLHRVTQTKEL